MSNQGWLCPKCGSAHAPHIQTCPLSIPTIAWPYPPAYPPFFTRFFPAWPYPGEWIITSEGTS